jgi:hypothetical protein
MTESTFQMLEFLRAYADVILSFSIAVGLVYGIFIFKQISQSIARNIELTREIREREFHSKYSENRLDLERKIADLSRELARTPRDFEQVNHLLISGQERNRGSTNKAIDTAKFLGSLSVDKNAMKIDSKLVFVLTPFHPSEERTYAAIVQALTKIGVRVMRGDETQARGDVLSHILAQMISARLVIANVSSRNPNVMYELGIAHALGKDVVIIANSGADLPFDVNSRRILFYKDHDDLVESLRTEIARVLIGENDVNSASENDP